MDRPAPPVVEPTVEQADEPSTEVDEAAESPDENAEETAKTTEDPVEIEEDDHESEHEDEHDDPAEFERQLEADAPNPQRGLLETGQGFALRLPADAVDNILATLSTTPHDGYRPVVAFGPGGQIMLTFEEHSI